MGHTDAPGVQMKLIGQLGAGDEGAVAAILAVAENRRAERDAVHAQLMRAPRHRQELEPGGAPARDVERAIVRDRALAVLVDRGDAFAAVAAPLGERAIDLAGARLRLADHDRPIELL